MPKKQFPSVGFYAVSLILWNKTFFFLIVIDLNEH